MKYILQHVIFPDDKSLDEYQELFYRGTACKLTITDDKQELHITPNGKVQFNTYLNGFTHRKWKKYTGIERVALHLFLEGKGEILLCGYSLIEGKPTRKVFSRIAFSCDEKQEVVCAYPLSDETMLAYEISAASEVVLAGGFFETEVTQEELKEIELAITTTTFRKEEYIKKTVNRIQTGLFERYPEQSTHIHMHVVDNGRTLLRKDIPENAHFFLHPNPNAGGSGGFARGMIECLHQTPKATHVLLMDDDVLVLPESIFRTYQMLRLLKEEYRDYFISGAMLENGQKNIQHEDIGCIEQEKYYHPVKPSWDHFQLKNNLLNENDVDAINMYQAWWYCCIPIQIIRKNGLPLPLFIRGDDMEYGVRCNAKFISMNGICIWHDGFAGKYSGVMDIYQPYRNLLVTTATTGVPHNVSGIWLAKRFFRESMLKHNYRGAEITLRAVEDYLQGPEFFMTDRGEQLIREISKLQNQMVPYDEIKIPGIKFAEKANEDIVRTRLKKFLFRITYNGHLFVPVSWLKKEPVIIPVDGYTPAKMTLVKTCVAVDEINKKACVWEMDRRKFWDLQKRYFRDIGYYRRNKEKIQERYQERRDYLTSESFWRKYLGLDSES